MKLLSRSIVIMFLFDMLMFCVSTAFWHGFFGLREESLLVIVLPVVLTGLFALFLKDNYKIREFNNTKKNAYLLFEGVIFSQIPAFILLLAMDLGLTAFWFTAANTVTIFAGLKLYRFAYNYYLFHIKRTKNILIIGTNKNAKLIADEIIGKQALKMNVIGFVKDVMTDAEECLQDSGDDIKVYSMSDGLDDIIAENSVNIVILAIHRRMEEAFLTQMVNCIPRGVKLYTMQEFYEMVTGKYFIDKTSVNRLFFDFMKKRSVWYDVCKRIFDIIASAIILTVTSPILLYIAIRVKLTDGGNPVYTQNRIGKDGKVFKAYKLRTMYRNDYVPTSDNLDRADDQDNDDRVIPFCKFVRRARFDEIPQTINILKGEMSITGPRAEWEDLVNIYSKEIKSYAVRMWVKTGWTGWAQINQGHCINGDDEMLKLQYDLYYLKHRNVLWEIGILIKAVFLALGGRHG